MKKLIFGLVLCAPFGIIAGLWSGSPEEGFKVALTGIMLAAVGAGLAIREDCK